MAIVTCLFDGTPKKWRVTIKNSRSLEWKGLSVVVDASNRVGAWLEAQKQLPGMPLLQCCDVEELSDG